MHSMRFPLILLFAVCLSLFGQKTVHETTGREIPHQQYLETVSQAYSPLEKLYIKTGDGLYVAAALRKPKGPGPFPTMIVLHGAPGGRGMDQLVNWSLGKCGGPVWEGLLREGYVVVVGDYRGTIQATEGPATAPPPIATPANSMASDVLALLDHVRTLPYVDSARIGVYGVSLGGDVALHVAARSNIRALILGAPAARTFLGAQRYAGREPKDDYTGVPSPPIDEDIARKNIAALRNETLLLVGTKDSLMPMTVKLFEQMHAAGKKAELHVYRNGYHDFPMGPQCHDPVRFPQPFIDATEHSFRLTVDWLKRVMAQ
jgi:dipeptidyl aminopeptidase/acylaminoacyl peptidase